MNKKEFYKAVAEKTGMTQKDTKTIFETGQEVMFEAVRNNEEVKMFDGVGFTRVLKDARTVKNPRTGEAIDVPAKYVPKVKIGSAFKTAVM